MSCSPAGPLPGGSAGAGGLPAARAGAGGCVTLGAMFATSRAGCAAGWRPALPGSRAASPDIRPGRAPRARARREGERKGSREGGRAGGQIGAGQPDRDCFRRGREAPPARGPGGRGLMWSGGGAGLAAEVAQPPLPRPSLKKGCGSRHFSSLKIKLSPPFALLFFRLRFSPFRPPGQGLGLCRGGAVATALLPPPRRADRGPAREAGPSVWAGGGSARQPGRATAPCWRAPSPSAA